MFCVSSTANDFVLVSAKKVQSENAVSVSVKMQSENAVSPSRTQTTGAVLACRMHECRPEAPAVAAGGWLCDTLDETEAVKIGCSRLEEKRYRFSHSEMGFA